MKNFKLTRYIPPQYVEYKPEIGDYPKDMFNCYVWFNGDNFTAMFFIGKQSKPTWHYNFRRDKESMKKKINETISQLMSWEEMKEKRKIEKKEALSNIKVGDLFASSWGYEQTNVDFYQVTAVKGKSFTIKRIAAKTIPGSEGFDCDKRSAVKDAFLDETKYPPITKRSLKLNSYSWLSPTTEQEAHYCSWYY